MRSRTILSAGVAVAVCAAVLTIAAHAAGAATNSVFNPRDFAPQGRLELETGAITFDTDTLTVSGDFEAAGTNALNQSGNVELAVFCFHAIELGTGVTVTVQGNRGLALLSRSDIDIATTISVNGTTGGYGSGVGGSASGGAGGPGGESGNADAADGNISNDNGSFASTPPSANRGRGGDCGMPAQSGYGYGGGQGGYGSGAEQARAGSGGGYGGSGGRGGLYDNPPGRTVGGDTYGSAALLNLYGGSGGGGGCSSASSYVAGSGGGGALELCAVGIITVTGNLQAMGADGAKLSYYAAGGGGSGGAILLAAAGVDIGSGTIDASGGDGSEPEPADGDKTGGGGGGGGRVAIYSYEDFNNDGEDQTEAAPSGVTVNGGAGGDGAESRDGAPGLVGTFYDGSWPIFPIPPKGILLKFQ